MGVKAVATFAILQVFDVGPICFAVAQLLYALTMLVGYYGYFYVKTAGKTQGKDHTGIPLKSVWELLPTLKATALREKTTAAGSEGDAGVLDRDVLRLAFKFSQQSLVKYFLTEGDRIILSLVSSLYDQGVYSLVANYGSLVARLLFQPLEETSRNIFSKLLPNLESTRITDIKADAMALGFKTFETVLRLVIFIGCIFVAFGPSYSYSVIDLLLGSKWSSTEAPKILAWYTLYVFTMALNGITEGFVVAVANREQITSHNYWMVAFFAVFSVSAYFLMNVTPTHTTTPPSPPFFH